jgi:hypothetical protein
VKREWLLLIRKGPKTGPITSVLSFHPFTLTTMVAAKSVPQNHLADPFEAILRPPQDETSAQRDARILAEQLAKRVSDAIDEQLRAERAELKKSRPDVRILLLGQSESGKSTTLKRTCSIVLFFTCQLDRGPAHSV